MKLMLHFNYYIDHFTITTFLPFHYMYGKTQFKATCIVQASLSLNEGIIIMAFTYKSNPNDSAAPE